MVRRYITKILLTVFLFLSVNGISAFTSYESVRINNKETGRNVVEGYNLGIKGQCVEFVKRFYYERYNHKMPNTYGDAKDFFDKKLVEGYNRERDLYQFTEINKIKRNDIIVFDSTYINPYGHIAIVEKVEGDYIYIYQQNSFSNRSIVHIKNNRILGFLTIKK